MRTDLTRQQSFANTTVEGAVEGKMLLLQTEVMINKWIMEDTGSGFTA